MTHEDTRKVEDLKELILAKAEAEKGYALKNAREEAKNWINDNKRVHFHQSSPSLLDLSFTE